MDIVASETDMSIAQQFLMKLGGKEIEHTFQIITEPKKLNTKTSNQVLHGTFAELAHSLEKLNKAGNGIFVCVNQTDGKERKAENITKVRAVFADFDEIGQGLPKLAVCGLSPQLVVESSLGKIHAYWLVSDCPLSEFKSIQQAIAAKLGSDKAVNDLPRVMRVPGFIHQKDPNNLFQTRIVEINANEAYSVDKIKAGLGLDLYPALKTTHSALYDNKFIKHSGIDRIKSALLAFPVEAVDDRDIWLRVAMCLHSDSPEHLALWLEWSKQSDKYDEPNAIYTWDSLGDKDSEITLASLFYDARKYGWIDDTRPSRFELTDEGVFFNGTDKKGEALAPEQVCSSLRVVGTACGSDKQDWGRCLEFSDRSGLLHRWSMPMSMMAADGAEYRSELLRLGLEIAANSKAKTRLADYITTSIAGRHFISVEKTGWHKHSFVLPHKTIGADEILYQSTGGLSHAYANKGAPAQWKENVAKLCAGNSRLVFSISTAFAAPLLHLVGMESGGFHLRGDSSTGKTTALRVAASVWGGLDYMQRWRATSNGLEGLAALHNDGLLVLDELSQCDPREAGNIAYMLSNGSGKVRANRSGSARASLTWRLLFLSAGEISLSQHMQQAGQRPRAGQEIRLIDLPADAGKDLGLFDTIHGHSNGAAFSKLVVENCTQYHGRVGNDYLNELCKGLDNEPAKLKLAIKRLASNLLGANTDGQLSRGAERFAVVGVAGELATKWGFTGWDTGEAEAAAKLCFSAWVDSRGGTKNHENGAILSQVQSFFELHGESRFTPIDRIDDRTTYNRAGFRQEFEDIDGCTHTLYYCLSEAYNNEICRGFDPKLVSRILIEAGYLIPDNSGKSSRQTRLPGQGNVRCYHIRPTAST